MKPEWRTPVVDPGGVDLEDFHAAIHAKLLQGFKPSSLRIRPGTALAVDLPRHPGAGASGYGRRLVTLTTGDTVLGVRVGDTQSRPTTGRR